MLGLGLKTNMFYHSLDQARFHCVLVVLVLETLGLGLAIQLRPWS